MLLTGGLWCALLGSPAAAVAPEGPAPTRSVDPEWQRRRRRLRAATIGAGAATGAALLGVVAAGVVVRTGQSDDRSPLWISAGVAAIPAVTLIVVGAAWELHEEAGARPYVLPPPPDSREQALGLRDPRRDPEWRLRDRRLTRAMIGTGATTGVATIAALTATAVLLSRPPCEACEPIAELFTIIGAGTVAVAGALALTGVAMARSVHRDPLRRWRAAPTVGGLTISF